MNRTSLHKGISKSAKRSQLICVLLLLQADASMLSSIIMVQDLLIESQRPRSRPVHVVGVVRCQQTVKVANYMVRDLAQGTMTAELLQPDELVSGLMAQVRPSHQSYMCLRHYGTGHALTSIIHMFQALWHSSGTHINCTPVQ